MATSLVLKSGSPLIGSPITYSVIAGSYTGVISFHKVYIEIKAAINGDDHWTTTTVSQSVAEGEQVELDISSALRAAADRYEYDVHPPQAYPFVAYSLAAYDQYMQDGEIHTSARTENPGGRALMGAYSDLERLLSNGNKLAQHFTRKPKTGMEVVAVGESFVYPQSFDKPVSLGNVTTGPSSVEIEITQEGAQTINGRQVYAHRSAPQDRYEIRFINGLGCMESVSLRSLRTTEVNIEKNTYVRSLQETFGAFSRNLVTKENDHETWSLSTGPINKEWQSWYLHEFLMSTTAWIKVEGHWLRCHIMPNETISGLNRTDNAILEVVFEVQFDMNGSLSSALLV